MPQRLAQQQAIDTSDPTVARWIAECGIATAPVKIKLTGQSREDVMLQAQRLKNAFGALVHLGSIEHHRVGNEWVIFGSLQA